MGYVGILVKLLWVGIFMLSCFVLVGIFREFIVKFLGCKKLYDSFRIKMVVNSCDIFRE